MFTYPVDEAGFYRWVLIIMVGYLLTALLLRACRTGKIVPNNKVLLTQIFDGATMSGSATLLWGIIDPLVLRLLGSTTFFLLVAGVAGVAYSIFALWPEKLPD
ncbi:MULTISPECIES: hypothetical protein [Roseomonadaceae]|uniref:Uncharacterized protein n=1 Tax=Falsiroseomonas oleicola TaxID=2801474 RepID=A0ABS6H5U8_9PROT|nr:hypothetical protein [Roseomonas oleicola]MBU8544051.1 hypothetical protein [Roseomonas oleicola]